MLYKHKLFFAFLKLITYFETLTETLLRIPFICDWLIFLSVDPLFATVKMRQNLVWFYRIKGGFLYTVHYHDQDNRCRVFEEGYEGIFKINK
jgi:hypothetical protein